MKYLFRFNEGLSQKEIDDLLDRINNGETLSAFEILKLKNANNSHFNTNTEEYLISEIKKIVDKHSGCITMGQIQAESSPVYKSDGNSISLVECLFQDHVQIVDYSGDGYETVDSEYTVPYEDLDIDTLQQIKDLLDNSLDYLEED